MLRYTLKRLAVGILTLAALATITFFLMKIIPGSPFGGELAQLSPEVREMLYAQYNLDKSIPEQFLIYLGNLAHGDFGISLKTGREISDVISESFSVSATLGGMAAVLALIIGLVLGSVAALCRGRWPDRVIIFVTTLFVSVPSFILATILLLILSYIVGKTKIGRAMRAVALDRDASALMGVDINRVITITFFIGGCLAGVGGVFYGIMYPTLEVSIGSFLGNKAFIAAVIGGIGNIKGAMVGGILMGVIEIYATSINADVGFGVFYLFLIIILLVKPAGLFGKLTTEKV